MMRGRVLPAHDVDAMIRREVRLVVEVDDRDRMLMYATKRTEGGGIWPGWYDPHKRPEDGGIPEDADPFVLYCTRDVAYAVYQGLRDEFETSEPPAPNAGDRAYGDARADIDRLHGLVDRLLDIVE